MRQGLRCRGARRTGTPQARAQRFTVAYSRLDGDHERTLLMTYGSIPAKTRIGHVHLRVSDLDRAIRFYRDLMGFDLVVRMGDEAAFLSAGGYHHHIGLNTWQSKGGSPPPRGTTGLY